MAQQPTPFAKRVRRICDAMIDSPKFPCRYPDCGCSEKDKAVEKAKAEGRS